MSKSESINYTEGSDREMMAFRSGLLKPAQTGRSEIEVGPLSPIPIPEMEVMVPTKKSGNYSLAGKSKIDQQTKLPLSIEYLKVAAYK